MKEHKKHGSHPHDKMAAMPQFNEGHWEKKEPDVTYGGSRYSSEMNQCAEYKKSVDGLSSYVKGHKPQH
jgi:hypothetical protein